MKLNLKDNTLGFIHLTGWYFKRLAMGDSKARAVYEKAKADACDAHDTAKAVSLMTKTMAKTVAKAVYEKAKAVAQFVAMQPQVRYYNNGYNNGYRQGYNNNYGYNNGNNSSFLYGQNNNWNNNKFNRYVTPSGYRPFDNPYFRMATQGIGGW